MFERFSCSECSYIHENMEVLKKHMIASHKKEECNWGLEIKIRFDCQECDLEFTSKSMLRTHVCSGHTEVNGIVVKYVTKLEEDLTQEEMIELTILHEEAMVPIQEEEEEPSAGMTL